METTELDFIESKAPTAKAKTSNRIQYEAQVAAIKKQIGSIEDIRQNLGLSQRKISQLLLVDPSSWTRWSKRGDDIPPHIYRALQWYMILQEKIPGLTPQYFVGKDPEILHQKALQEIKQESTGRAALENKLNLYLENTVHTEEQSAYLHEEIKNLKKELLQTTQKIRLQNILIFIFMACFTITLLVKLLL